MRGVFVRPAVTSEDTLSDLSLVSGKALSIFSSVMFTIVFALSVGVICMEYFIRLDQSKQFSHDTSAVSSSTIDGRRGLQNFSSS